MQKLGVSIEPPDQTTLEKLIELGQYADGDPRIQGMLDSLKVNPYVRSIHGLQSFEWLRDLSWADSCAVTKAVVRAEAARLTQSGGSVSAVKSAYRTMDTGPGRATVVDARALIARQSGCGLFGVGGVWTIFAGSRRP